MFDWVVNTPLERDIEIEREREIDQEIDRRSYV